MMNPDLKKIYYVIFAGIFAYSTYGIFQMGAVGGPCNAGVAIIFFMPVLLITSALQLLSFNLWWKKEGSRNWFYPLISIIGILIWGWALFIWLDDENAVKNLFYLSPFLIFSTITFVITILKVPRVQSADTDNI